MKYLSLLILALGLALACNTEEAPQVKKATEGKDPMLGKERPLDPWVFRSVLDENPRMITLALHQSMWAAYSTQTSSLYKVWNGGVNLDGAVYTTKHGPQPSTLGDAYVINEIQNPWKVMKGDEAVTMDVQYKGHAFDDGQVTLKYNLTVPDGKVITVTEQPECIQGASGSVKLERTFVTSSVPTGYKVVLDEGTSSTHDDLFVNTKGGHNGPVELIANDTTVVVALYIGEPKIKNQNVLVDENLPKGLALINSSDCRTCHNEIMKTVGPSYESIAKKYDNTEANHAMLASKVRVGGTGVWGGSVMNGHPDLPEADLKEMISYIMDMDAADEVTRKKLESNDPIAADELVAADKTVDASGLSAGLHVAVHPYEGEKRVLADIDWTAEPGSSDLIMKVNMAGDDFGVLDERFGLDIEGYIKVTGDTRTILRLASDDGSKLFLHGKEVIDNDGLHGTSNVDAQVALESGFHPIRIQFFENGGGQALYLLWREADSGEFVPVPASALYHKTKEGMVAGKVFKSKSDIPGDQSALESVHPSYEMTQARPDDFISRIAGLDLMPDGRAVVSTWDAEGAVYIIDGVQSGIPAKMTAKKIASGLAEPLGLSVVDGDIYVMQKQEMTKLVDTNGDEYIDEYQVLCNDWDVTANFHEFGFGMAYKDNHFYATLATGIQPGGASALNQPKHRGSAIKVNKDSGKIEFLANGLRTPNGIGIGIDNEVFVADNQGDWLPSSKIVHVSKDAWFGSRSVDYEGTAGLKEKKPMVWLPQNEIGNSPSTPLALNDGPYKNQMIHGEVTHGGVKRVFVEKVNGEYQGCVFRFIQGLEAGVNRLQWGPDGALYAGGVGSTGNWQQDRKLWYGLQRMKYNGKTTFEMLSVSARTNGVEITFTAPLSEAAGDSPNDYEIKQWYYLPTKEYGGPKLDEKHLDVLSVNVSKDRTKVFLELDGMKEDHVVYVHLMPKIKSATDETLWSTEAWYTMNSIPQGKLGEKNTVDLKGVNVLSAAEKAEGWELLFDGETTKGWRNYKKQSIGSSWKVVDGALTLMTYRKPDGSYGTKDGGDLITDKSYKNYEFSLEWKITDCGNSGIIYNVHESDKYDYVWQTGPEMQVLDNKCHPDAQYPTHRAGDLYDMIACSEENVRPANQWNKIKLRIENGKVEHWQNGKKLVEFEMFTPEWAERIAKSKFKDMPGFGIYREGHIALQDHSDRVAFRNIKIKKL